MLLLLLQYYYDDYDDDGGGGDDGDDGDDDDVLKTGNMMDSILARRDCRGLEYPTRDVRIPWYSGRLFTTFVGSLRSVEAVSLYSTDLKSMSRNSD